MARRAAAQTHSEPAVVPGEDPRLQRWGRQLEIVIAIALGLAAIVTAGSVYLNEKQEHKATIKFNEAIHAVTEANAAAIRAAQPGTPDDALMHRANLLNDEADHDFVEAEDQQERATRYTLIEVVLASSLFLFGVAGVGRSYSVKVGALGAGTVIFLSALALLATA